MPRWVKHILGILFVMTVAACSGSSGCSGCDGITPLPAGFDNNARIENAASVRVTESGLNFIESNIGNLAATLMGDTGQGGIIKFPIDTIETSGTGYSATVCPDGPDEANDVCVAEINLADAQIDLSTINPHDIFATGTIPLRLKILPIDISLIIVPMSIDAVLSGGGNNDCNPDTMSFAEVPVEAQIAIEVERDPAHSSRLGYSKLRIVSVVIDEETLTNAMHFCGGGIDDWLVGALKGFIAPMLLGGFTDTISESLNDFLCQAPDDTKTPPCPNGSTEQDGKCMYPDGSCVSMMLGLDGNVDLSGMLASISPGTSGGLDFLFAVGGEGARPDDPSASWGDLNPTAGGATLGMFGGVLPNPISDCVKPVPLDPPTGIPQPNELMGNALPGWTGEGPHVGFALSERFLNHSMAAAYNSGVLCLGVSTEQVDMLSTGLFALLVPSIKFLTYQKAPAPLAIVIRPQKPPTIVLGDGTNIETDPLLMVTLPEAMIDFYVWSSDRYVRAFTAQFDLQVPVNLEVSADGLTPILEKIYVKNAQVTNSDLLKDDPATIATALSAVIEGIAGDFLGDLGSFAVSDALSSLGLTLDLRQEGIKRLHKGDDNFLGVFAAFGLASSTTSLEADTSVELAGKSLVREGFRLTTATADNRPRVVVRAASSLNYGSNLIEYTYKLDNGFWRPWQSDPEIVVDDAYLLMQGVHRVSVKSRIAGRPDTEDRSPAIIEVRVDVDPPVVDVAMKDGSLRVDAWDIVSRPSELSARYRFDTGEVTEWVALEQLAAVPMDPDAASVIVDVRDEEGNVASKQQGLIRGRPDPTLGEAAGGCGCAVPGTTPRGATGALALLAIGLLGVAARFVSRPRREKGRKHHRTFFRSVIGTTGVLVLAGSWTGCNCGDETSSDPQPPQPGEDATVPGSCGEEGADPCVVLEPGMVGSYTSAAVAPDGTIWVAGYNEGDWEGNVSYGDLVVGKWNGSSVDWESVDGVPDEEVDVTVYDPESWRGGLDSAGDDVGQWTSMQLDDSGNPKVAYWDITNKALKLASYDGTAWSVSTVFSDGNAEAGRYAKMLMVGGMPIIAFQVIGFGDNGHPTSKVVLARASSANPSGAGDWSFEDVAVDETTPCRNHLCAGSQKCFLDTKQCATTTSDCDPKCASGTGCLNGACLDLVDGTRLDTYPDAIGDYISLAAGPAGELGVVYYDRVRGNLMQARQDQGTWVTALLDGQTTDNPPVDTGDVGIGASLAIDSAGDWHISYVDGFKESLKYMQLTQNGASVVGIEVVDDGTGTDAGPFDDGHHVVGDDSHITVSTSGDVRIAYQDATVGTLRWAVGAPGSGAGHTWKRTVLQQEGFGGFFPRQIMVNSSTQIVNWWRKGGTKIEGDVRVVAPN